MLSGRVIDPTSVATIWQLFARRAALTPERTMLRDEDDRLVTFGDAHDWCERLAAGLHARGIGPATVVSWQLPTRVETVIVSLALARLGAVQNPIIPAYREREVTALLRQVDAEWFLHPGTWRGFDYVALAATAEERLARPLKVLTVPDELPDGDRSTLPPEPEQGEEIRWLYATSGTMSEPKAVRHSDQTLLSGGLGLAGAYDPAPDDIGSVPYPIAHIGGPLYLLMMLLRGRPITLLGTFVPNEAIALMRRHGVTMSGGSTAFYLAFIEQQRAWTGGGTVVPGLRMLSGGGAPKPPELFWQVRDELGVRVLHGYGMTECPMIASGSRTDTDEQLANTDGAPVIGCEIQIVGAGGEVLDRGVVGEICVRGPMVCKGYVDANATAAAFDGDGFFHTGDLGYVRADGHVVLTGRAKEMIIRKGENLSPREIEDVLQEHPRVGAVAVIGLPDSQSGERVCAVVEMRPGAMPLGFAEMQEHCRAAGLMTQKIPERLEIVDALPRNATLKILKNELRTRFARR